MTTETHYSVVSRLLDSVCACITPETARRLLEVRADAELQSEVDSLADKSTEGTLTPQERERYDTYIAAASVIAILQAHSRAVIRTESLSNGPE
jgi:hypothetical protein